MEELKCNKVCEILQKPYGESAMKKKKKQVFTRGVSDSKMSAKTLKMTSPIVKIEDSLG
jgi:hypothetical protein